MELAFINTWKPKNLGWEELSMGNKLDKGKWESQIGGCELGVCPEMCRVQVMILTSLRNVLGERLRQKDGSVEFHDLVKTNVGTSLAKGLAHTPSMQCEPRRSAKRPCDNPSPSKFSVWVFSVAQLSPDTPRSNNNSNQCLYKSGYYRVFLFPLFSRLTWGTCLICLLLSVWSTQHRRNWQETETKVVTRSLEHCWCLKIICLT